MGNLFKADSGSVIADFSIYQTRLSSDVKFLRNSESIAFISLAVPLSEKVGDLKNSEKSSRTLAKAWFLTSK